MPRHADTTAPFDVDISVGEVPSHLEGARLHSLRFDAQPGRLLFKTRTIANYLIENGSQIRIQPKPDADRMKVCNLLFGGVTGALLIQRRTLALHGCTIATPGGGAVVVCGESGAGKSTLAGLLLARGLRVLDDNIAALVPHDDEFLVQPGLGFMRLTGDSLQLLGQSPQGPGFAAPYELKYMQTLPEQSFANAARPLRHIYLLDRSAPALELGLSGKDKLTVIQKHTFVEHMLPGLGELENHFRLWLALANRIPVSLLGQPPQDNPAVWADKIAQLLLKY